ncbi:Gfo/Idh/MocA family protein [Maribacter sp. 2-571]|uniref:Gfo/Idh/MocA family protein n=1 Tax=Maribacter sp. 2-571 TaxID=3417569 RepID=UPI003D34E950
MENEAGIVRWGIIGCGKVTEVKSGPAYQQTKGFELNAVMRRDSVKGNDYAKRHGVPRYFSDADTLIHTQDIDAIYIATPPDTHKKYGLLVAKAGKPCCIEKPMAPSYADSLALYEAFENKGVPLFIAYYRRSLPRFIQVKKWLDEGEIGTVIQVRWHLSKPASDLDRSGAYNWRTDAKIAPGGYFDDLASHGIDLFMYLLGTIKTAQGYTANRWGHYSALDTVTACWMHENGVMGTGSWSFGSHEHRDEVEIIGSKGVLRFSVFHERPLVLVNQNGKRELLVPNPDPIQKYHVENIQKHLLGSAVHPSLGASGLQTSWVMDQILIGNRPLGSAVP